MKLHTIILFISASLSLYSCDNYTKSKKNSDLNIYGDTCHLGIKKDTTYPAYYLGDTAKLNCQSITILKCEDDFTLSEQTGIPTGKIKNVFVQIRYTNTTTNQVTLVEPSKWILIDPAGEHYPCVLDSTKLPILQEKTLLPKESYVGWLTFKSPYYNDDFDAALKVTSYRYMGFSVVIRISLPK